MELELIRKKIYEVRGIRVIMDFDLAELYEIPTKALKQAVRRNIKRFPSDFMLDLSPKELKDLRSHSVTSKRGGTRYAPFAFTELGVAMLSSILNNPKAIKVNISIMRTFVVLRQYALNYKELTGKIARLEKKYNRQFRDVYEALDLLLQKKEEEIDWENRERIGFLQNELNNETGV
ncbi:MAG: ORF6N domain-containing protein [Bacteroidetes bacterium]|nr:ORF6N domain-containing protein [Bacteroidota bacterium]